MPNNVFIPELIASAITAKLGDKLKLTLITKKQDLSGQRGGDVVKVPQVQYIGTATKVPAGQPIPVADFAHNVVSVDVAKYGRAIKFTEEEVNSAYTDVQEEAEAQLIKSVADGIEKDMFTSLGAITGAMLHADAGTAFTSGSFLLAQAKFGENLDEATSILVNGLGFAVLQADKGYNPADRTFYGMDVIVSNRVPAKTAYLVQEGAIGLYLNQDIEVEVDKDISDQTYLVVGTAHAAVHVRDTSKAVKLTHA